MRTRFEWFNHHGGKFRVAVANVCNLDCFFCHNEGMANPRRPGQLPVFRPRLGDDRLLDIVNAWCRLGGRQVNITGGEPLAHRRIVEFIEAIDRRQTRIVLNTNAVLAHRLLQRPRLKNLEGILASLHTTDDDVFRRQLGGRSVTEVMRNIVALSQHGYDVEINYSLGPYNRDAFGDVLAFAERHRLRLKAIAFVRSDDDPSFYGGDWVDPVWLDATLERAGARRQETIDAVGGRRTRWKTPRTTVVVKNIAEGRLRTDFCLACPHAETCGEGIYGLRVGVDALWKPCLLRREAFTAVDTDTSIETQILARIDAMVGRIEHTHFVPGAPR